MNESTPPPARPFPAHSVGFSPRPFALLSYDDQPVVLGWGMTLPDGSVVAVDWRTGPSTTVAVCRTTDSVQQLLDADLVWIDRDGAVIGDGAQPHEP